MNEKYIQLLELQQTSKSFSLDKTKQLYRYLGCIYDHFRWQRKKEFVAIMNRLLKGEISLDQYMDQFQKITDEVSPEELVRGIR